MKWIKNEPVREVHDGDCFLVAIKVRSTRNPATQCYWEHYVATIRVEDDGTSDMEYFETGDDIGWLWSDVDYFMPIDDLNPEPPTEDTHA